MQAVWDQEVCLSCLQLYSHCLEHSVIHIWELDKYLLNEWTLFKGPQPVTASKFWVHRAGCGGAGMWLGTREAVEKSRREWEQVWARDQTWRGWEERLRIWWGRPHIWQVPDWQGLQGDIYSSCPHPLLAPGSPRTAWLKQREPLFALCVLLKSPVPT